MPSEVCGKQMLDKVPGELHRRLMLEKRAWWTIWKNHFGSSALCRMLAKCHNLRAYTHVGKILQFAHFDACWQNVTIFALWRILAKGRDLSALTHVGERSRFKCFDACWQNVTIYALWRMLAECRVLRTLPGTKFRLPGAFNYSAPLLRPLLPGVNLPSR